MSIHFLKHKNVFIHFILFYTGNRLTTVENNSNILHTIPAPGAADRAGRRQ